MNKNSYINGFSLLELLITIAIIVSIAAIGSGFYINYGKSVEIKSVSENISFDLKQAQSKSMIGEGNFKWGIHFVNGVTDYYEIFSTPTDYSSGSKVIISTNYLPASVTFSDPISSSTKDIIFNKISGGTTASSVTIISSGMTKIVGSSSIGKIYIE